MNVKDLIDLYTMNMTFLLQRYKDPKEDRKDYFWGQYVALDWVVRELKALEVSNG